MPIYAYTHSECGTSYEGYFPLTTSTPPTCTKCGGLMDRTWTSHGNRPDNGYPYVTKNIHPDGRPIEVTSPSHEAQLCKQYGVVKRDDAGWLEKEYLYYDLKKKRQVYKEASGMGMPGVWY